MMPNEPSEALAVEYLSRKKSPDSFIRIRIRGSLPGHSLYYLVQARTLVDGETHPLREVLRLDLFKATAARISSLSASSPSSPSGPTGSGLNYSLLYFLLQYCVKLC
jgi:hypothetical protein